MSPGAGRSWVILPPRRRMPGWTTCSICRAVVDNVDLVEIARPGNTKGVHCCQICAQRRTGGHP